MHSKLLRTTGLLVASMLGACSTHYNVKPEMVARYKAPPAPSAQETQLYLIRGSAFQGSGRGMWVAVNDQVVADLASGSHVLLKTKAGLNSVNFVQGKAGFAYMTVDNRGGQTVFAAVDYATGALKEVPRDLGISMVMETTTSAPLKEPRPNDAYDNLLLNPELLDLGLTDTSAEPLHVDAQSAVITFYRPAKLIAQVPFTIWSEAGYAGSLLGNQYVQVRVDPGTHTFIGFSERLSVLKATVEAGKEYAAEFDVGMGWNQAHIKLLPVNLNSEGAKVDAWRQQLKLVGASAATLQKSEVAPRVAAAFDYLKALKDQWGPEEVASRSLKVSDGR